MEGRGKVRGCWGARGTESRQPLRCMIRGAERMMRGITTDTETEKCDMSVCVGMSVSQRAIVTAAVTKTQEERSRENVPNK